jgi:hypothetical protein
LARIHAIALSALLGLFLFRVIAQLAQALWPSNVLPAFEAWHSGTLPYPVLVLSQVAIIALLVWFVWRFWRVEPIGGVRVQAALWIFALLYLAGSVLRFVAGFTFATQNAFMAAHLPAFFHIVLAMAVTVIASYASLKAKAGVRS